VKISGEFKEHDRAKKKTYKAAYGNLTIVMISCVSFGEVVMVIG